MGRPSSGSSHTVVEVADVVSSRRCRSSKSEEEDLPTAAPRPKILNVKLRAADGLTRSVLWDAFDRACSDVVDICPARDGIGQDGRMDMM
jgi:hypothetical protein